MILGSYINGKAKLLCIRKKGDFNFRATNKDIRVILQGSIYNLKELSKKNKGEAIIELYTLYGEDFIKKLDGEFSIILHDIKKRRLILARDRFGAETLFYCYKDGKLFFSTNLSELFKLNKKIKKEINKEAVQEYLLRCYISDKTSIFKDVNKVEPAHYVVFDLKTVSFKKYWDFPKTFKKCNEDEVKDRLLLLIKDAIRRRITKGRLGVSVSGGLDSSTLLALISKEVDKEKLCAFTYKCEGKDVDETGYARKMAEFCSVKHKVFEFGPKDLHLIFKFIKHLDEPSCDIGVEEAFYKTAEMARKEVRCLFMGFGGDELFAGHPQYITEKLTLPYDILSGFLHLNSFASVASKITKLLGDSDYKKDARAILKKFFEGLMFPSSLSANRWRVYYTQMEINLLFKEKPVDNSVILKNEKFCKDRINNAIFLDYSLIVPHYFNRIRLSKPLGLNIRVPLLDSDLVEYCATLPSNFKMKRFEGKYLLKEIMKEKLPPEIVYRKNKMGNSIPMKRWVRYDNYLSGMIGKYLSKESVEKRGLFNYSFIEKMIEDHKSNKANNANRIWALIVLELWFREHID